MSTPSLDSSLSLSDQFAAAAKPLNHANDLDPLMDRIGDARFVLLGEASHGTHEYYTWRAQLSRRLIQEKGFRFIAVEGDWPDCYELNRFVKGYRDGGEKVQDILNGFQRWPTWMWANWEVAALLYWMREYNEPLPDKQKVGFYGLDMYSLWESMDVIVNYMKDKDPEMLAAVKEAYQCFEPFNRNIYTYARSAALVPENCQEEVLHLLTRMSKDKAQMQDGDTEAAFNAEQNAYVAVSAEKYYRQMMHGGSLTWNIRDMHMTDTLNRLMPLYGPDAKAIVWEHNTHIGDARYTDMAGDGMYNVGQLVREQHGNEGVVLVGFGSYQGTVMAGDEWGAPMKAMQLPEGRPESWEAIMHESGAGDSLMIFDNFRNNDAWMQMRGHRAIGVVYHPSRERYGNYVPTVLPNRYDAFIFLDKTKALHALHLPQAGKMVPPETFPFGV